MALTFIEKVKQYYAFVDTNHLFDLILHKSFGDLIEYINNPQQEQQQVQEKSIEYLSSTLLPTTTRKSNVNSVWSIQRCSKIFLHNENDFMYPYSSFPQELIFSKKKFIINWKSSMIKCIDASPIIILLDEYRQYVIIGSHAGLINAYHIHNGQLIWSFQANDRIEASGTISRNGHFVLVGKYFRYDKYCKMHRLSILNNSSNIDISKLFLYRP